MLSDIRKRSFLSSLILVTLILHCLGSLLFASSSHWMKHSPLLPLLPLNTNSQLAIWIAQLVFRLRPSPSHPVDVGFPTIAELDSDVDMVLPVLRRMKQRTFFRIFKVDLTRECPFWAAQAMCSHPDGGCSVCECDKNQIPQKWIIKPIEDFVERRTDTNGYDNMNTTQQVSNSTMPIEMESTGISLWDVPDSFFKLSPSVVTNQALSQSNSITNSASPNAIYVDLILNKPVYTAYKGAPVWRQVYNENCMGKVNNDHNGNLITHPPLDGAEEQTETAIGGGGGGGYHSSCREEQRFYRIISGLQSNIAALSSEYYSVNTADLEALKHEEALKQVDDEVNSDGDFRMMEKLMEKPLEPNLDFFTEKLGLYPNRIENLYLTFSVLLKAVCKLATIMEECTCDTGRRNTQDNSLFEREARRERGSRKEDLASRADLLFMLNQTYASCHEATLSSPLFETKQSRVLHQFHNISRILDCVECQKCRLHGKLKMTALQLALRTSGDSRVESLERNEVTALVNALYYFAHSIEIVRRMELRSAFKSLQYIVFYIATIIITIIVLLRLIYRKRGEREMRFPYILTEPDDSKLSDIMPSSYPLRDGHRRTPQHEKKLD